VTAVDPQASRRPLAEALGAAFAAPDQAPGETDVVFHASASGAGLDTAIGCAGMEATVVEMSWYGDKAVEARLGGAFHSRRLKLVSSQVGQVSPGRRPRWDYRRRMAAALGLLDAPALDLLVAEEIAFEDTPRELPRILAPGAQGVAQGLAPVIRYSQL
jgi:threonine dehydrogenase-like Zn-dependent dehydrogenase